ncbi:MAG: sugar phosphate isomerase/epimerase [Chloroflexi bacterium]|nr:sugar phosphate isomerase/epimerase [Chloroflexota bacterium]
MRFGYTTWSMQGVPAEVSIPTLAAIGFDSIEITVVPGWRDELDALTGERRRAIRRLVDQHGLVLPAIAGHRSLVATDPAEHAENWRRLTGAIDLAVDWASEDGPPVLDTTTGGRAGEWIALRDRLVDRLARLADYAAARGVTVAIEPHVSSPLNSIENVLWLLKTIDRPNLRLAFDISHFNVQGIPIEESVTALAPHTVYTHIKDERGVVPDYAFLIPGEGDFDYARYLRAMDGAGYRGDIHVEISLMVQRREGFDPIAAARQSYEVVSAAFVAAGVPRDRRQPHAGG